MKLDLFHLFGSGRELDDPDDELDRIILYTKAIILHEELIGGILDIYKKAKNENKEYRVNKYILIYFTLEQYITTSKPPLVRENYTKERLRGEIKNKFAMQNLPEKFRLIFLRENEQLLILFTNYTRSLAQFISSQENTTKLTELMGKIQLNGISVSITQTPDVLDFTSLNKVINQVTLAELVAFFQNLNNVLYSEIATTYGQNIADDITKKEYSLIKEYYAYDLISKYLKIIPNGILDRERLAYMTREDLEEGAKNAVEEKIRREVAEKSSEELKRKVEELNASQEKITKLLHASEKMENELRIDKDQIQTIISSMNEGLLVVNRDMVVSRMNNAAIHLLNISEDGIENRNFLDIFSISQNNITVIKADNPVYKAIQMGKPLVLDIENNLKLNPAGGGTIPIMISVSPLYEKNTVTILGAVVVFRDISETVKYEQTLNNEKKIIEEKVNEQTQEIKKEKEELSLAVEKAHESYLQTKANEAKLLASIKSLPVGFILTDMSETIIEINTVAKNILKITESIKTIDDIDIHLNNTFDFKKQIETARETNNSVELPEVIYNERILHVIVTPIFLAESGNTYLGTVILVEDITDAKMLERTKNEFFSIASHELRTPLTAIQGFISLLKTYFADKLTDPEVNQIIDYIDQATTRLIRIVNDFLSVSRLEQGKIEFKIEAFNLASVIDEVVHEVGNLAEKKQLTMVFTKKENTPETVTADRDKTKQILTNLIGNAIKFTNKGQISIYLEGYDKFVVTKVTDTGKGIPRISQNLLFQKFQQAQNNLLTRDVSSGTGLGLFISKKFIENMGGTIVLEHSEEDHGSTFTFSLPKAPVS